MSSKLSFASKGHAACALQARGLTANGAQALINGEKLSSAVDQRNSAGGTQQENLVFSSVSNVLKTRHDTAKNSIGNIR